MKNKIEVIDFIKGYSMFAIVIFHYFQSIPLSPVFSKAINFGGTGIHTFIFASGYGLFLSHLQNPIPYREFLKKRFTKIYIPYILVVSVVALISLFIPLYKNSWNHYFSHIFLYKMFDNDLIGTYGYQLWFISTIIQFYLLFPLILRFRERIPGTAFLPAGLLISWAWAAAILILHKEEFRNWNSFFLMYLWEFMLGMYCAERYLQKNYEFWKIRKVGLIGLTIAGVGIYSLMALKSGAIGKTFNDVPGLFGFGALCIFIYSLNIKPVNRFILFTAGLSYSIFLIHFLVLNLFQAACLAMGISWSWVILIPVLTCCYLAAMPLQRLFGHLTGIFTARLQNRPVLNK